MKRTCLEIAIEFLKENHSGKCMCCSWRGESAFQVKSSQFYLYSPYDKSQICFTVFTAYHWYHLTSSFAGSSDNAGSTILLSSVCNGQISLLCSFTSPVNMLHVLPSYFKNLDSNQTWPVTTFITASSVLSQGVPQGSVIGPLLLMCYMLHVSVIIYCHSLYFHCHYDEVQLYFFTNAP